jgi:hypothetical protein
MATGNFYISCAKSVAELKEIVILGSQAGNYIENTKFCP